MTRKHTLEKGLYYIGDPCYVIADEKWLPLLEETGYFGLPDHKSTNYDDGLFTYNEQPCFARGTAYGDGCYLDNNNVEHYVDAGLLCIIPVDAIDERALRGVQYRTFDKDFEVWFDDGVFYFGDIEINTN